MIEFSAEEKGDQNAYARWDDTYAEKHWKLKWKNSNNGIIKIRVLFLFSQLNADYDSIPASGRFFYNKRHALHRPRRGSMLSDSHSPSSSPRKLSLQQSFTEAPGEFCVLAEGQGTVQSIWWKGASSSGRVCTQESLALGFNPSSAVTPLDQ